MHDVWCNDRSSEDLQETLVKYLSDKINRQTESEDDGEREEIQSEDTKDIMQCLDDIPGLDVRAGLKYCLDKEFYEEMLKEYMYGDKADVTEAIRLGALDFIKKPFFPTEFL